MPLCMKYIQYWHYQAGQEKSAWHFHKKKLEIFAKNLKQKFGCSSTGIFSANSYSNQTCKGCIEMPMHQTYFFCPVLFCQYCMLKPDTKFFQRQVKVADGMGT